MYRHFPSKEALFQAVVTARVDDLVADARRRRTDPDAGAALHHALAVLLKRAQAVGAVRQGITASDLITILKGLFVAAHDEPDPDRSARLLAVLADGLHPPMR